MSRNLREAKELISDVVRLNRNNAAAGIDKKIALQLEGDAGLGKTSAVLQFCKEQKMDLYKLNLAQIEELGDLVGYPMKKYHIKKAGEERIVGEKQLIPYYKQGWVPSEKDPVMSYAVPEWIAGRSGSGILLLDDWTRADPRFIQAVMELIDRGKYISWQLPPDWHIVLTSNPDNGEYLVASTDNAQKTRFMSTSIGYDAEIWAAWAENYGIDPRCINFMLLNPEVVEGVRDNENNLTQTCANPRQWVNFFLSVNNITDFSTKENLAKITSFGDMTIGQELVTTFISFIHQRLDKLIEPKKIVLDKDYDKIKKEIKDCIGEGAEYRNDIASVLSIRLGNWLVKYAKDNPIPVEILDRVEDVVCDELFGADLSFNIAININSANRSKFSRLITRDRFMKYLID